jgi:hypothetical protein
MAALAEYNGRLIGFYQYESYYFARILLIPSQKQTSREARRSARFLAEDKLVVILLIKCISRISHTFNYYGANFLNVRANE